MRAFLTLFLLFGSQDVLAAFQSQLRPMSLEWKSRKSPRASDSWTKNSSVYSGYDVRALTHHSCSTRMGMILRKRGKLSEEISSAGVTLRKKVRTILHRRPTHRRNIATVTKKAQLAFLAFAVAMWNRNNNCFLPPSAEARGKPQVLEEALAETKGENFVVKMNKVVFPEMAIVTGTAIAGTSLGRYVIWQKQNEKRDDEEDDDVTVFIGGSEAGAEHDTKAKSNEEQYNALMGAMDLPEVHLNPKYEASSENTGTTESLEPQETDKACAETMATTESLEPQEADTEFEPKTMESALAILEGPAEAVTNSFEAGRNEDAVYTDPEMKDALEEASSNARKQNKQNATLEPAMNSAPGLTTNFTSIESDVNVPFPVDGTDSLTVQNEMQEHGLELVESVAVTEDKLEIFGSHADAMSVDGRASTVPAKITEEVSIVSDDVTKSSDYADRDDSTVASNEGEGKASVRTWKEYAKKAAADMGKMANHARTIARNSARARAVEEARKQPKSSKEEKTLARHYGSMSPEDRAFHILLDLGMIDITPDPEDPLYDDGYDDEYCVENSMIPDD